MKGIVDKSAGDVKHNLAQTIARSCRRPEGLSFSSSGIQRFTCCFHEGDRKKSLSVCLGKEAWFKCHKAGCPANAVSGNYASAWRALSGDVEPDDSRKVRADLDARYKDARDAMGASRLKDARAPRGRNKKPSARGGARVNDDDPFPTQAAFLARYESRWKKLPSWAESTHPYATPDGVEHFVFARGEKPAKGGASRRLGYYSYDERLKKYSPTRGTARGEKLHLYGVLRLADLPDAKVLVVEGERVQEVVQEVFCARCVVVTWSGGCGAFRGTDWTPLRGRDVVVVADEDAEGRKAAVGLSELLCSDEVGASSVSVSQPRGHGKGYDLRDVIEAVGDDAASRLAAANDYIKGGEPEVVAGSDVAERIIDRRRLLTVDAAMLALGYRLRYDARVQLPVFAADSAVKPCAEFEDNDTLRLQHAIVDAGYMYPSERDGEALVDERILERRVRALAALDEFDWAQDFIADGGVIPVWDGVSRVDGLLEAMGVMSSNTDLDREIISTFYTNLIRRIMRPGCRIRNSLVLIGPQGSDKSTICRDIWPPALRDFATAEVAKLGGSGKELREKVRGAALVEWAEAGGRRKVDVDHLKNQLTILIDTFRAAYGRFSVTRKRDFVVVVTTNDQAPLPNDKSGNTRFMVLRVGVADGWAPGSVSEYLNAGDNRMQLFAEFRHKVVKDGRKADLPASMWAANDGRNEMHRDADVFVESVIKQEEDANRLVNGCPLNWIYHMLGAKVWRNNDTNAADVMERYQMILEHKDHDMLPGNGVSPRFIYDALERLGWVKITRRQRLIDMEGAQERESRRELLYRVGEEKTRPEPIAPYDTESGRFLTKFHKRYGGGPNLKLVDGGEDKAPRGRRAGRKFA